MVTRDDRLTEEAFRAAGRHLDELVREFEALPLPEVQAKVFDLLQTVDALHRAGLSRLVGLLRAHDQGAGRAQDPPLLERAAEDPVVRMLLLLYDLMPAAPSFVRAGPLAQAEAAPAAGRPASVVIPLTPVGASPPRPLRRPVFRKVTRREEVPPGTTKAAEVDGVRVLLANVGGEVYAVRDACPDSGLPLSPGSFAPPVVVCPWHNEAFDVRTGKRADGVDGPGLDVLPIVLRDGTIQLAVDTVPELAPSGVRAPSTGDRSSG